MPNKHLCSCNGLSSNLCAKSQTVRLVEWDDDALNVVSTVVGVPAGDLAPWFRTNRAPDISNTETSLPGYKVARIVVKWLRPSSSSPG